jgi:hypothetical protein
MSHNVILGRHNVILGRHNVILGRHNVILSRHNVILSRHNVILSLSKDGSAAIVRSARKSRRLVPDERENRDGHRLP